MIQHYHHFMQSGLSSNPKAKNDRYHVFVHYPKLSENESDENFTKNNHKALMDGLEEWELAVPGIFFHLVEYEAGTIFNKIEALKDTCPRCKFVNTRVPTMVEGYENQQVPETCQKENYLHGSPWNPSF